MRVLIVFAHPDYFKQQLEELHATEVGGFMPAIEAELERLESCDLMIWQFPLWWFGLLAILKGYASHCTSFVGFGATCGKRRRFESLLPCFLTGGSSPGGSYRHSFLSL
jgi:putative NADPH-quinone reductase